jgi:hypothetical protein
MLNYTEEQITQVMGNLDKITCTGINNARLIVGIFTILNSPTKEEVVADKEKLK